MKKDTNNGKTQHAWKQKLAVVTGASSGIGAATARKLGAQGLSLMLVARRGELLAKLADEINRSGGDAEILCADVSREEERLRVFETITKQKRPVDILVNNAGIGWYGYYADMPWSMALEMIQVNTLAVAHLSSLILPQMRARNSGHIINVGSIAGGIPSQGVALYSATKSFLDAFTTALHRELRGSKVFASIIRPGPVSTGFFKSAKRRNGGRSIPAESLGISAQLVADRIWGLLKRPRRVVYVPWYLGVVPWVEAGFGWLMDLLGPRLLKRKPGSL
ncbi:MAG TPA: SDR family oxidoreductase [Anaerolineae bacterium]|nr:SDR family oxidoreductase [Anaerolineae bacterium]